MRSSVLLLFAAGRLVSCACECGYSIADPESKESIVFMDRLETDFTQIDHISQNHDWVRQEFTVSAEDGRGVYGKTFTPINADTCIAKKCSSEFGGSGLNLGVSKIMNDDDDAVPGSEIDTTRLDLHWGSFRAGIKLTATKGTCAAFFWYFNDTQEIDMEFLSREFDDDKGIYPINLVVQSKQSAEAGYDASKTGNYKRVNLTFNPTEAFHEYRFDYTPRQVLFYADSNLMARMEGSDMPSAGGHLILQHWSNGNPLWSGGPPAEDATVTVSYVKAYFNSSDSDHQSSLTHSCLDSSRKGAVCAIPNVTQGNATTGGMFFGDSEVASKDGKAQDNGATYTFGGVMVEGVVVWISGLAFSEVFSYMMDQGRSGAERRGFEDIVLENHTDSKSLFAHVTGRDEEGVVMLLADGKTVHRPKSPSEILQPVGADHAIPVGGPGTHKTVRIPHIFGGRIWFCKDKPLTFLLNPGPAVVEPSVTNPTDPNFDADWGFCEFTFNNDQLYVNVSYVDFVSLPIGLKLENEAGKMTSVPGMPKNGLDEVCAGLRRQGEKDGAGWDKLVVTSKSGANLRALSPNAGAELHPGLLEGYFVPTIDAAWERYANEDIVINTQAEWGDVKGR
ncbi:hypothetical protein FZEAL_10751, partial [Fusarium zealandicum]